MLKFAIFLVKVWEYRFQVLMPLVLMPFIILAWAFAYNPLYEATTIIGVDRDKASSPILMNVSDPNNALILERRLKGTDVVKDAIIDTGAVFGFENLDVEDKQRVIREVSSRVKMVVLSDTEIRINYKDDGETKVNRLLEGLAANFIDEVLAPERVRVGDLLASLGNQVQLYSEQEKQYLQELNELQGRLSRTKGAKNKETVLKKVVSTEFNVQKASAQKELAQSEYEELLVQSRALMGSEFYNEPNAIMWLVEPPVSVSPKRDGGYYGSLFWLSIQAAIVLALILLVVRKFTDSTLRTDEEIDEALGLKILGRLPSLGNLKTINGRLVVTENTNIFGKGQ